MLKMKWTDRIKTVEVFQKVNTERLLLEILNNRRYPWIVHIIFHNVCAVNIYEETISE
jgi:hypothetical protein